jgi:formate dehydrogenase subunit gamma
VDADRVLRFTGAERAAHWAVAAAFVAILASATSMPGRWTLASVPFDVHVGSAAALVIVLAALVAARRPVFATTTAELRELDEHDLAWLRSVPARLFSGAPAPPPGRFNAGQKLNARLSLAGLAVLYVSGVTILAIGQGFPQGPVHAVFTAGMIVLVGGHVFMAAVNPGTRHAMRGMLRGDVDRAWAAHHHPRWPAAGYQTPGTSRECDAAPSR